MSGEGNPFEKVSKPAQWFCDFPEQVMGPGYKPLGIRVHVKDGVYYQEGVGFVNEKGARVIMAGAFLTPRDHLKIADDLHRLRQLENEVEQAAREGGE